MKVASAVLIAFGMLCLLDTYGRNQMGAVLVHADEGEVTDGEEYNPLDDDLTDPDNYPEKDENGKIPGQEDGGRAPDDASIGHWSGLVTTTSSGLLPENSYDWKMVYDERFFYGLITKQEDWTTYITDAVSKPTKHHMNSPWGFWKGEGEEKAAIDVDFSKHNVVFLILGAQTHGIEFHSWNVDEDQVGTFTFTHHKVTPFYPGHTPACFAIIPKGGHNGEPLINKFVWKTVSGVEIGTM